MTFTNLPKHKVNQEKFSTKCEEHLHRMKSIFIKEEKNLKNYIFPEAMRFTSSRSVYRGKLRIFSMRIYIFINIFRNPSLAITFHHICTHGKI